MVVGSVGSRSIAWGDGPGVRRYTEDDQPSNDPVRANRCGWNARVHVEYEGQPAVDWYVPVGTPVVTTMNGTATLSVVSTSNPFDVYRVSREPYIGNPDRDRAPLSPFAGPGGGQGVFVTVTNAAFTTTYAHLDIGRTIDAVRNRAAFLAGYSADSDFARLLGELRDFRIQTPIARWDVVPSDVIGMTGDSGYSEAPHLHYTVRRAGARSLLCPTMEPGFTDGGWLLRTP
jgi:murein DD-endopeptidase MepM/ murein hydrolase activator NlpD